MKTKPFFMIYVEGGNSPTYQHESLELAEKEAKRLTKILNTKAYVLASVKSFKLVEIEEEDLIPDELDPLPF